MAKSEKINSIIDRQAVSKELTTIYDTLGAIEARGKNALKVLQAMVDISEKLKCIKPSSVDVIKGVNLTVGEQQINRNRLMGKPEIASKFKVSTSTIDKWMRSGKISFIKIGGRTLFDPTNCLIKQQ
jgi:hypothetical protein